jgi:hypothetical protein
MGSTNVTPDVAQRIGEALFALGALVDAMTSRASPVERRKLFRDNAITFYRLWVDQVP